jgi:protein SCO1/2
VVLVAVLLATVAFAFVALQARDEGPAPIVPETEGPFRGNELPPGIVNTPAPDFRHTDVRGGELDTRSLAGTPYAVTFLYTDCPDVCQLIGQELGQALELLGERSDDVAVVAVSVDPRGDTPGAVDSWLEAHDLPQNFHYLIGSERELQPTWDSYYAAPQVPGDPESSHSASIWLVDAEGRIQTKFSAGAPVPPQDIAHDFRVLLEEAGSSR